MATIRLRPQFLVIQFFLFFVRPRVSLDGGEPQKIKWRAWHEMPVAPGKHRLFVYFPYLVPRRAGPAEIEVSVDEGQTTDVRYRAPLIMFSPGKMRQLSA